MFNLKVDELSKYALKSREMKSLVGGTGCGCGCVGSSSTCDNGSANASSGTSSGTKHDKVFLPEIVCRP